MLIQNPEQDISYAPQKIINSQVAVEFPIIKWAQNKFWVFLAIRVDEFGFKQVEVGEQGQIKFTAFKKNPSSSSNINSTQKLTDLLDKQGQVFHFNECTYGPINLKESGQKEMGGWLQLYLKKKKQDPSSTTAKPNPHPLAFKKYETSESDKFWKFVFKNEKLKNNPRVKTDWDKFSYEDEEKDMREDFDPEKLISLMKRNGEWDEERDPSLPEDANGMEPLDGEEEDDEQDQMNGGGQGFENMPNDEDLGLDDEQLLQFKEAVKAAQEEAAEQSNLKEKKKVSFQVQEEEQIDTSTSKQKRVFISPRESVGEEEEGSHSQDSFMDKVMNGGGAPQQPEDEDANGRMIDQKEREDDEFLFENYLRTGGYMHLKKKAQTEEELERELLDEDQLMFKSSFSQLKRQKV